MFRSRYLLAPAALALAAMGCSQSGKPTEPTAVHLNLPRPELRAGTAVVILVDTSGSMEQAVRDPSGGQRPKFQIARDALERIIRTTEEWKKKNPDKTLQLGIANFSSSVTTLLPVSDFDAAKARAALKRLPHPNSGTAIGRALEEGYEQLYNSGLARKYILCITDGENTSGIKPEYVARQAFEQTKGEVELQFIAFDTSAKSFRFLKDVNGHVVEAADGPQLQQELTNIYEKRILVEKPEP